MLHEMCYILMIRCLMFGTEGQGRTGYLPRNRNLGKFGALEIKGMILSLDYFY